MFAINLHLELTQIPSFFAGKKVYKLHDLIQPNGRLPLSCEKPYACADYFCRDISRLVTNYHCFALGKKKSHFYVSQTVEMKLKVHVPDGTV